ncbi:MAG: hypothetical protein M3416_12095 [Acidobacteriota bacterium]|nr:hypothetical protein [Acidobacteriota bacterium]
MAASLTVEARLKRSLVDVKQPVWLIGAFILVQFLWGALMFLPGAQSFRMYVRALPYLSSLALFAFYYGGRKRYQLPAAGKLVTLTLLLLIVNLAHPETQLPPGVAHCAFQLSIVAPVFWAGKGVRSPQLLNKLLLIIFAANSLNALVGLLQVYFPQHFMPPEFSALAESLTSGHVEALTYEGASGQKIIRPPGLSDLPGGAAVAGMTAGIMGVAFYLRREWRLRARLLCLAMAGVGMVTLYLTQVRAFFLMMVFALAALCAVVVRRGQRWEGLQIALISLCLIVGSFTWALAIGGDAVSGRFVSIADEGLISSVRTNRGHFAEYTLNHLLYEYPLGAGLGRWGMMAVYFADPHALDAPEPIHVEIQMTGWLLDGGVLMWLFYGAALAAALRYAYRQSVSAADRETLQAARIVFCFLLIIAGVSFAGPAFNTQLGIQFWFLFAALHGAQARLSPRQTRWQRADPAVHGQETLS